MNRIREIRNKKGVSGTDLAARLNITPQYLYGLEKETRNLSADMATRIATIFGVSVDYLLGNVDEDTTTKEQTYYALTDKDERDIAKDLERIMDNLESKEALSFYGEELELDADAREILKASIEQSMRLAKQASKKKFTPKKYR